MTTHLRQNPEGARNARLELSSRLCSSCLLCQQGGGGGGNVRHNEKVMHDTTVESESGIYTNYMHSYESLLYLEMRFINKQAEYVFPLPFLLCAKKPFTGQKLKYINCRMYN
jgi:hypothetical protein